MKDKNATEHDIKGLPILIKCLGVVFPDQAGFFIRWTGSGQEIRMFWSFSEPPLRAPELNPRAEYLQAYPRFHPLTARRAVFNPFVCFSTWNNTWGGFKTLMR